MASAALARIRKMVACRFLLPHLIAFCSAEIGKVQIQLNTILIESAWIAPLCGPDTFNT
jgi:hypothetical protein